MKRLNSFERFITMKAYAHAYEPSDVDDFKQEGRIAAWQALKRDPLATNSYVHQAIEWRMIDYARKVYAQRDVGYSTTHENILYGNYGDDGED